MSSLLSPILANLVVQNLELFSLNELSVTPLFYVRYVEIFTKFNSHHRLQFTMEIGGDSLSFLIKKEETFIFDWYRKLTFSGRFLNYFSWHPLCQKIGTIIGLIDRVLLLSHPSFHKKNFDLVIKILLNNGLSSKFDIFNYQKKTLQKI